MISPTTTWSHGLNDDLPRADTQSFDPEQGIELQNHDSTNPTKSVLQDEQLKLNTNVIATTTIEQVSPSKSNRTGKSSGWSRFCGFNRKPRRTKQDPGALEQSFDQHRPKLSWQQLTICLIVEAIALGTLGMPSAFASMGMILGVVVSVILGFLAIYTSHVIGQVKLKYMDVMDYAEAVRKMFGRAGYEITSVMFVLLLVLILGSHTLTGTIAFNRLAGNVGVCDVVWAIISAVVLFALALPPSFSEFSILGYIDFASIIGAISIATIAAGIHSAHAAGGVTATQWSWAPPADMSFAKAFLGSTNMIFAYTFAVAQFTFMAEMDRPQDYPKAIWSLGLIQMSIYTTTGALCYAFIGNDVTSPVLLSVEPRVLSRIAFGVALPVIFISGSINCTVTAKYILNRYRPALAMRRDNVFWTVWTILVAIITLVSFVIAQAVPFFSALLGLISSLFTSGFTFYFPALFWFLLIKEGKWNRSWSNVALSLLNALVLTIGVVLLGCGTYVSVWQIKEEYATGTVRMPFSCGSRS